MKFLSNKQRMFNDDENSCISKASMQYISIKPMVFVLLFADLHCTTAEFHSVLKTEYNLNAQQKLLTLYHCSKSQKSAKDGNIFPMHAYAYRLLPVFG